MILLCGPRAMNPEPVDKTILPESGDQKPLCALVTVIHIPRVWLSIRRKCISRVNRKIWQSWFKCTFQRCDYIASPARCQVYTKSLLCLLLITSYYFIVHLSADFPWVSQPKWFSSFYDLCLKPWNIQSGRLTNSSADEVWVLILTSVVHCAFTTQ